MPETPWVNALEMPGQINPERELAQIVLEVPIEIALSLDQLGKTVHQRRTGLARSILIQGLRKIQTLTDPPTTLGDIENAIMK